MKLPNFIFRRQQIPRVVPPSVLLADAAEAALHAAAGDRHMAAVILKRLDRLQTEIVCNNEHFWAHLQTVTDEVEGTPGAQMWRGRADHITQMWLQLIHEFEDLRFELGVPPSKCRIPWNVIRPGKNCGSEVIV